MALDPFDLNQPMSNAVRWRLMYRQRRYCRHLKREELNKRIRDILLNMLVLTPEAKIGMLPITPAGAVWIEKWTHVLEEMVLRYGPYPNGFDRDVLHSEPFPDLASDLATKAVRRLGGLSLKAEQTFIKYGKAEFMRGLYGEGRLRLQPASFFRASDHNGAVRDDELTIPVSMVLNRDEIKSVVSNPQDVPENVVDQRVDINIGFGTDYWLYCVTTSVNPRLFMDFEAEACVIIKDRAAFCDRVAKAAQCVMPEVDVRQAEAVYYDPLLPGKGIPYVPLIKYFGYSYQAEYRFCWVPRQKMQTVRPIDLKIGGLQDIAELIEL